VSPSVSEGYVRCKRLVGQPRRIRYVDFIGHIRADASDPRQGRDDREPNKRADDD